MSSNFLRLKNSRCTEIPETFLELFSCENITVLDVEFANLLIIRKFDFKNFLNLKHFTLIVNKLKTIVPKSFQKLQKLEYFNFEAKSIETLPSDFLSSLSKLEHLQLSVPELKNIPYKLLKHNGKLRNLKLDYCNDIEIDFIKSLRNIEILDWRVSVDIIFFGLFQFRLDNLRVFKSSNAFFSIEDTGFFQNLTHLYLTGSVFRKHVFSAILQCRNLKIVHAVNNSGLVRIDCGATYFSSYLTYLNLSCNRINYIAPRTFSNFPNLQVCNMSNNFLLSLSTRVFQGLTDIIVLNLSHNFISFVDFNVFSDLQNLQILDLKSNYIQDYTYIRIFCLKSLTKLFLGFNKMKTLRLMFSAITVYDKMELVDFQNNNIETLNDYLFMPLSNLKFIYLKMNCIRVIEHCHFQGLHLLEHLDLSFNLIRKICPATFSGLSSLKILKLSHNQIRILSEDFFKDCSNLEILDLSSNHLVQFSTKLLQNNRRLKFFLFHDNYVKHIPIDLFQYSLLHFVNLSNNPLDYKNTLFFDNCASRNCVFIIDNNFQSYLMENNLFFTVKIIVETP